MNRVKYLPGIFLALLITMTPWQAAFPAVKHFTDAKGTIHISNNPKDEASWAKVETKVASQPDTSEAVNPQEPTPSNIFPEPEAAKTPAFLDPEPEAPATSSSPAPEADPKL